MSTSHINTVALPEWLPTIRQLEAAVARRRLSGRTLKTPSGLTLRLYNYSKETQFQRDWDAVTSCARGLVICLETGEVIAAPLSKFFNLGEQVSPGVVAVAGTGEFSAYVKMDGSLGIGYRSGDVLRWATRGSFESTQSAVAQAMWQEKYRQHEHLFFGKWRHITPMAEIIHPDTRVVVRYNYQDLVLIAARNRETGEDMPYEFLAQMAAETGMPLVERLDSDDLDAILRRVAELDDNSEGFVINWGGYRVKVKGEEYKRLHRLLSGITPATIAESWFEGGALELLAAMPEEFREESEATFAKLDGMAVELLDKVDDALAQAPAGLDQKGFAQWSRQEFGDLQAHMFERRKFTTIPGYTRKVAVETLTTAMAAGKLSAFGTAPEADFIAALDRFAVDLSDFVWDSTRTREDCNRLSSMVSQLPKSVRGVLSSAVEGLQPGLIAERVRQFVARTPECAGLDVTAMFLAAPEPDSPAERHYEWVNAYPGVLRSLLDRFRACGRRQTATSYARKLVAEALRTGCLTETLAHFRDKIDSTPNGTTVTAQFEAMADRLLLLWEALPHGQGAKQLLDAASSHDQREVAQALVMAAWRPHREKVMEAYIEENGSASTFDPDA